jgi:Domain of unknown function (DUF4288)
MGWSWFGVKTLYRTTATGRPSAVDALFDRTVDLVEERVVLLRARTSDEAIARAEVKAREYAREVHINPYGQRVVCRYLDACDAFELFDAPGAGVEAFSSTFLIPSDTANPTVIDRWLGQEEPAPDARRRKFLNRRFSGAVGKASKTPLQPARRAHPKTRSRRPSRATRG